MTENFKTTNLAAERDFPSHSSPSPVSAAGINREGGTLPHSPHERGQGPVTVTPAFSSICGAPVGVEEAMDNAKRELRVLSLAEALNKAFAQPTELYQDIELNNCRDAWYHGLIE